MNGSFIDRGGEIEIVGVSDFDLYGIFECGQCFRWNADESGVYTGVAFGRVLHLRREQNSIFISCTMDEFHSVWFDYFDLGRDYENIRDKLNISDFMRHATAYGVGIRILRQDKWEALCSFIISQNNHIPRIKKIVEALCSLFGKPIEFDGGLYYSFPTAERLCALNESDLAPLRCGYRADYILSAARAVAGGSLDLEALSQSSISDARKELLKIRGVGNKVADCVLLFGLGLLDSFPVDVWMKRALSEHFSPDFDPTVFSPYAGIAQQYIFHYVRSL